MSEIKSNGIEVEGDNGRSNISIVTTTVPGVVNLKVVHGSVTRFAGLIGVTRFAEVLSNVLNSGDVYQPEGLAGYEDRTKQMDEILDAAAATLPVDSMCRQTCADVAQLQTEAIRDGKLLGVEVLADDSGKFCGNSLKFKSAQAAVEYGKDLSQRWTSVREFRVVIVG